MQLSDLGEREFIKKIAQHFSQNLPADVTGIGDDCAIFPHMNDRSLLISTDLLAENVHFLRFGISPEDLGYKALAVNLSDIAAMGGFPLYTFLSLSFPKDLDVSWTDAFFKGFKSLAEKEKVYLLGGDTSCSALDIIINVVIVGEAKKDEIKKRSEAKPGDYICVTGYLGDSAGGLKFLLQHLPLDQQGSYLLREHVHPRPHLREGQWLAKQPAVHAMMDVSDGIDSDIQRIMEQSKCGADIHLDKLPLSNEFKKCAETFDWNAVELAASGGEDYCLLVTVDPQEFERISKEYNKLFPLPIVKIGEITNKESQLNYFMNGKTIQLKQHGYDHFAKTY